MLFTPAARRELASIGLLAAVGLFLGGKKQAGALAGVVSAALYFIPSDYSLSGKSVVITGGSRGLGLALACEFLRKGASVSLLARDGDELQRAGEMLRTKYSRKVSEIVCDITKEPELKKALEEIGQVDVLVNNAGPIVLGPFVTMERADFEFVLEAQLHAIISATKILRGMWNGRGGRIVNICSVGGKMGVPHLSPYCAAKFALAGLTQCLAAELAGENILVTTVFPGLMRTGSPIQTVVKGDHDSEYAWFALGDVLPGLSISAEGAARRIVKGTVDGNREVIFPANARVAAWAQNQFPELFGLAMQATAACLPHSESRSRRSGAQSGEWLESQPWYALVRPIMERAKAKWNQREKLKVPMPDQV